MQAVCGFACAISYAKTQDEKAKKAVDKKKRAQHKADKERIKTRGEWIKEAQAAFNSYIRERDFDQTCISCDTPPSAQRHGGQWDAGHYRSVGSAPHLRFNESNCFKQCVRCNRYLSGNHSEYRARLIKRIGLDAVTVVECYNVSAPLTIDQIKAIKKKYSKLARELKKARENG
jgi:hypothetical protein